MAGQETGVRFVDQAESLFEMWDELFGQRLSPRAVVDGVCELVMASRERAVEEYMNHLGALSFAHVFDEPASLSPCVGVVSAETVYVIGARISLLRIFVITRRQNDPGSHCDRASRKSGERRTLKLDEFDVLSILRSIA